MNVSIYKNTSDNLRVSKSLTLIKKLEGVYFYEESSILTPRLLRLRTLLIQIGVKQLLNQLFLINGM